MELDNSHSNRPNSFRRPERIRLQLLIWLFFVVPCSMCVERVLLSCFCTYDIFLSVGLSHRVHHVLPHQQLRFANIASQPIIMETCKQFGVEWEGLFSLV